MPAVKPSPPVDHLLVYFNHAPSLIPHGPTYSLILSPVYLPPRTFLTDSPLSILTSVDCFSKTTHLVNLVKLPSSKEL